MSDLPADASESEIHEEIAFISVLIDSLDTNSEDYETLKAEHENAIQDLENRLSSRHQGTTTPERHARTTLPHPDWSGQSFNLPSRPLTTEQSTRQIRSTARTENNRPSAAEDDDFPGVPDSVKIAKKRRRPSSLIADYSQKSRRLGDYYDASEATTPTSSDSLDEAETTLRETHGLNLPTGRREDILKRMQEQEKRLYDRIKMEQDDAKLARRLENESQVPGQTTSSQSTQSFLGSNGRLERPAMPAVPDSRPTQSSQPLQHVSNAGGIASLNTSGYATTPSILQAMHGRPVPQGVRVLPPQPTLQTYGGDDDLQEITPRQFSASVQGRPGNPGAQPPQLSANTSYVPTILPTPHQLLPPTFPGISHHQPFQMSSMPSVPGSWPVPPYATGGVSYSAYSGPSQNVNHTAAGYRFGGDIHAAPVRGRWMDADSMLNGLISGNWDSSPTHSEDDDMMGGPSNRPNSSFNLGDALHARGMDYMLNDPRQSREDLENLLQNIRPDDEIPAELRVGTPEGFRLPLLEHQKLGLTWLKNQEEGSNKGGILADDMGLGKTIQALALIISRRSEDPAQKSTIVLAPVSLMMQWEKEIKDKLLPSHALKVFIYHGQAKKNVTFARLSTYDVVLTTFGTVAAEWNRLSGQTKGTRRARTIDNNFPLLGRNSKWHRVIIDEAQCIKNKGTKAAQAACQLKATYRLCMTGTPMMNNVGELYSLIHFLRIPPYNVLEKFNHDFKKPLEGQLGPNVKARAMKSLQALLRAILLRRTKKSEIDGKPILNLPERTTEIKHAIFTDDEQSFYTALETQTQLQVNRYLEAGKKVRNYSYVLVRLLRLRQACCHPHLIKDFAQDGENGDVSMDEMEETVGKLSEQVVKMIKDTGGNFECPVCFDGVENPTIFFPCGHDMCSECFARMTDPANALANGSETVGEIKCPECRGKIDTKQVFTWKIFKKVHMPEDYQGELDGIVQELEEPEEDSDSETEDETEDDDEVNSQGNLDDFIVDDDAEIEYEASDEDEGDDEDGAHAGAEDDDGYYEGNQSDKEEENHIVKKSENTDRRNTKHSKAKAKGKSRAKKGKPEIQDKGKGKKKAKKTLAQLKAEGLRNAAAKKKYLRRLRRSWITSAKVDRTLEILQEIHDRDSTEKTIIFSQFTSLLDLLEIPIDERGYRFKRYDGSMSAALRNDAVVEFADDPNTTIMLVSLKAGNAGLNLNVASQVIILDPFWNPMIEEQAIDRAHRMGQIRPVNVHRILVANTVEDRIIELQEKKRELITQALDEKAAQSFNRLGRAELRYLFGITSTVEE